VLAERLEILGAPVLRLAIPEGARPGLVIARLCDVWPDGRSTRVTYAVRHARSPGDPGPRDGILELRLNDTAYAFLPGHRVRIALSTTWWPMVWPEAAPGTLRFLARASTLELPVRPMNGAPAPMDLGEAWRPERAGDVLEAPRHERVGDEQHGRATLRNTIDGGRTRVRSTGIVVHAGADDLATISEHDPSSARMASERIVTLEHPSGPTLTVTGRLELTSSVEAWQLSGRLVATQDGAIVADRVIARRIPRRVP
jgi:hypothetical protein